MSCNLESWHPGSFKFQKLNKSLELLLNYNLNLRQSWPFFLVNTSSLFSQRSFLHSFPAVMDTFTACCMHIPRSVQSITVHLTEQPEGCMSVTRADAVWRPFFFPFTVQLRLARASKSFKIAAEYKRCKCIYAREVHIRKSNTSWSFFFPFRDTTRQNTRKIKCV